MSKIIKNMLVGILAIPMLALGMVAASPVSQPAFAETDVSTGAAGGADSARGAGQAEDLFGENGVFTKVINMLLFLIGAISVVMLIYGGIRYTISGGDSNSITAAKNTILYAVIGIVVALLAFAIVQFVINSLKS